MQITIRADGHLHLPKIYDLDDNTLVPHIGDVVTIDGKPFAVYERVFEFEKNPVAVTLLCKPKTY